MLCEITDLSQIERRFHDANAASQIDADVFLSKYSRTEELLRGQGFEEYPYRLSTQQDETRLEVSRRSPVCQHDMRQLTTLNNDLSGRRNDSLLYGFSEWFRSLSS